MSQKGDGNRPTLKPVLSYRISAKELADAVERKRSVSKTRDVDDRLDDDLFRDLTLTDSSCRSLLADSETESTNSFSQDSSTSDWKEMGQRTWRSPQDERKRKMLEQRKQQWRTAKMLEKSEQSERTSTCLSAFPQPSLLNPDDERSKLERHVLGGSEKVSRCNSQRCPSLIRTASPLTTQGASLSTLPSPMAMQSPTSSFTHRSLSNSNSLIPSCNVETGHPAESRLHYPNSALPTIAIPFHPNGRLPSSPAPTPISTSPANWVVKRFGRHIGPARNPDCSCSHCLDHFARLRSAKVGGRSLVL